jgi:hypothetical protein
VDAKDDSPDTDVWNARVINPDGSTAVLSKRVHCESLSHPKRNEFGQGFHPAQIH